MEQTGIVRSIKRSILAFLFCLPTSLLALLLLFLLVYNGFSVFCVHLPLPAVSSASQKAKLSSISSSSSLIYAVTEVNPAPAVFEVRPSTLPLNASLGTPRASSSRRPKRLRRRRHMWNLLRLGDESRQFSVKVKGFLKSSSCKSRFFMTWISPVESFGERELFAMESLFKWHPRACLVMVSTSLDSEEGSLIFRPFLDKGFKLIAARPDFDYIFKRTPAEMWFSQLKAGKIDPGEIALEQNLSNLLRLVLLYKFGGVYLDTDVIVLKSLSKLRNVIGAQTIDIRTRNWSRLNNAVLIFDKHHPLLHEFIEEFALTFNGNKWGHNGPYLVSRVAARVSTSEAFNFTVLPPRAFYPVDWSRIRSFFQAPVDKTHARWLRNRLERIRNDSLTLHLWNRQSKKLKVEEGSIIHYIMLDCCVFCNSSFPASVNSV